MINVSDITKALVVQLESYADIKNLKPTIERGEYVNNDPDVTPWIGVYRSVSDYVPRTLGNHLASFQNTTKIRILAQDASFKSGGDCENRIEDLATKILECVISDKTIGGTVDMVNSLNVEYMYNETDRESLYYQTAVITVEVEVSTG